MSLMRVLSVVGLVCSLTFVQCSYSYSTICGRVLGDVYKVLNNLAFIGLDLHSDYDSFKDELALHHQEISHLIRNLSDRTVLNAGEVDILLPAEKFIDQYDLNTFIQSNSDLIIELVGRYNKSEYSSFMRSNYQASLRQLGLEELLKRYGALKSGKALQRLADQNLI